MSFGALAGMAAALGIAVALLGLAVRAAHRWVGGPGARRPRLPMEVLGRLALGQRQGLAVVRIGERVVVLSVGDGGVRPVVELAPGEVLGAGSADAAPAVGAGEWGSGRVGDLGAAVWTRLRAVTRGAPLVLALLAATLAAFASRGEAQQVQQAAARAAQQPAAASRAAQPAIGALQPPVPAARAAQPGAASAQPGAAPAQPAAASAPPLAPSRPAGPAPRIDLQLGGGNASDLRLSGTVGMVLFIGLLATLPALLLLMTSFTRILIVLHFLRQALGTQTAPPGQMLAALALLLTGFVMAPTLSRVNEQALQPWMNGQIDQATMMKTAVVPFREFMLRQTPDKDLAKFVEMSGQPAPARAAEVSLPVLMSAFATSELRAAFQMGFAIFLPFIVVDLVVSAVLTSMGMFMLPPTMIALPCKLLLFVLVDGWALVFQSLVTSFK
ncbi:MAG TPA: flagellar type III secretion system pore protein FliP [Longimicrobiales bacterium]|nr:flagellar type III secretion system pore protein FliP [Longimicrobiales bacterium]